MFTYMQTMDVMRHLLNKAVCHRVCRQPSNLAAIKARLFPPLHRRGWYVEDLGMSVV